MSPWQKGSWCYNVCMCVPVLSFDFFYVFQQLLLSYAKFTGNNCGFLASSNAEAWRKTPLRLHKWNPAIARLKILRDFIITMWITFGLYTWDGHLMGRKRVRDTLGPVSNHPVSTAATYSSSSSAQTFSICPRYGFSREDVGRKCSFITSFHNCTLACRLLRPLTGISELASDSRGRHEVEVLTPWESACDYLFIYFYHHCKNAQCKTSERCDTKDVLYIP